ncbi:hypothetical protein COCON_G00152240 [Conger conger]|uniref:Uncharacterized protein n=1 Tax=Conger conger TaxID=82655 RepID=A0A9Q1D8F3_CONCO|nr:hypothetical protein COCON_G00152240 [Conger conger]
MFSDSSRNWKQYRQEGSTWGFVGNSNADSVVQYRLQQPVIARFLRFAPLQWNPNGRIGLRVEVYGCSYRKKSSSDSSVVLLGSLLDDQHWHYVAIEYIEKSINFTVDRITHQFEIKGDSTDSDTSNELSFGGAPDYGKLETFSGRNFQGCLENLLYNDVNVIDFAKQNNQVSVRGNVTFACSEPPNVPVTFMGTKSYLQLSAEPDKGGLSVSLQFRTWDKEGLLITTELHQNSGTLWLYIREGKIRLQIDKAGRIVAELTAAVYEQSCEAYKHRGNTSGFYHVDADGSGPLGPRLVFCNMTDGAQFSWWVGRRDKAQMHWSGGGSVTQTCSCGLRETCVHPDQDCTCDPDGKERTNDSGLLSFKDHLPITEIAFGDLSRAGSEAAFKVGHLQCHGDKNFWNSAFFNKETSYLHFPTFHGELSADISFLFKTTASSGVFLENLGIKDFIRIELSSQNEVLFSYDVGNGPFEMRVETRTPLNDNQWHHVKAERNLKEASLRVDQLPSSSQEAPIDGHIHLQLNSQLFVGGTASRQKGFLGCIRSLQLNGVTLDLEERARITPGVSPGCPGHCSTYGSLCQNGGKCMEKYAGFSCDCSSSAFTGPFCTTEVSGYFEPGTSVTYYLKELNENSSAQPAAEMNLRGESVSFSFRTTQSPALLLYVSSDHREYIAALLNRYGHLNVIYKLQDDQDAEVFQISQRNMANGLLHTVNIGRESEILTVQIDQFPAEEFTVISDVELNSIKSIVLGKILDAVELDPAVSRINVLGFSGCISAVRFNSLAPLKTALLRPAAGNVAVVGQLRESHCGSPNPFDINTIRSLSDHSGTKNIGEPIVDAIRSESALIGGVIAVTIFVLICALAIMVRFLYRIKESFQSRSRKGVKADASARSTFNNDPNPRNILSETQKEYFI